MFCKSSIVKLDLHRRRLGKHDQDSNMKIDNTTDMMEKGIKREEKKFEMSVEEVINLLSSLSLVSVTIGEFFVVMRSGFDLTISGEPYTGLVLLLNFTSGKYFSRIWNQTVATGIVVKADQLMEACEIHFGQGRPCLGCPDEERNKHGRHEFLISQTPVPRRIATACRKVLGKDARTSVHSCSECTKLSDLISAVNEDGKYSQAPDSQNKLGKGEYESVTSVKDENIDEYMLDGIEEFVRKSEILTNDDHQEMDQEYPIETEVDSANKSKNQKYKCHHCPYTSSTKFKLKEHIEGVHEKTMSYFCTECSYKTSWKISLNRHIKELHNKGEKEFKCEQCSYASVRKDALKVHVEVVHEKIKNHVCGDCGYAASQKCHLKQHKESVHKLGDKKFKCEKCPYATVLKANLKMHIAGVHDNIKYVCEDCGYAASQKGHLKRHRESVHNMGDQSFKKNNEGGEERNHVCEDCGYSTSQERYLKNHIKRVHETIRNHICEECGNAFSQENHLRRHIKGVHENIRNHVCNDCGYSASQKGHLKQHIEQVHQKIKTHVCEECGYAASQKSHLKQHITGVHKKIKNHVCEECGFAASHNSTLLNHRLKVHNRGEKKFKCKMCPYATFHKGSLKVHIAGVHEKIMNHVCHECGYATSRKKDFNQHKESVHSMGQKKSEKSAVMVSHKNNS